MKLCDQAASEIGALIRKKLRNQYPDQNLFFACVLVHPREDGKEKEIDEAIVTNAEPDMVAGMLAIGMEMADQQQEQPDDERNKKPS